jgi:hypothetical protein
MFGITIHEVLAAVLGGLIMAFASWLWKRLGWGWGKYWLARRRTALYYAAAPTSVLLPYLAMQVCYVVMGCTWIVIILLGLAAHEPHDSFTSYMASLTFGVLLVGLFENAARILEVQQQAIENEDSRTRTSP